MSAEHFLITWPAAPGEHFAPGCLDGNIGKQVMVQRDGTSAQGVISAVEILDDGTWAEITVDVPEGVLPPVRHSVSIRWPR